MSQPRHWSEVKCHDGKRLDLHARNSPIGRAAPPAANVQPCIGPVLLTLCKTLRHLLQHVLARLDQISVQSSTLPFQHVARVLASCTTKGPLSQSASPAPAPAPAPAPCRDVTCNTHTAARIHPPMLQQIPRPFARPSAVATRPPYRRPGNGFDRLHKKHSACKLRVSTAPSLCRSPQCVPCNCSPPLLDNVPMKQRVKALCAAKQGNASARPATPTTMTNPTRTLHT